MSTQTARKRRQTMADKADIHELYEKSVQNVEHEVEFLQTTFQQIRHFLLFFGQVHQFIRVAVQVIQFGPDGPDITPFSVDQTAQWAAVERGWRP